MGHGFGKGEGEGRREGGVCLCCCCFFCCLSKNCADVIEETWFAAGGDVVKLGVVFSEHTEGEGGREGGREEGEDDDGEWSSAEHKQAMYR